MSAKASWNEWKFVAVALSVGIGACLVNASAWRTGFCGNCLGLAGCHFFRAVLLFLGFASIIGEFRATAPNAKPISSGLTVLDLVVLLMVLPGCAGCYPLWTVVLPVLAVVFL